MQFFRNCRNSRQTKTLLSAAALQPGVLQVEECLKLRPHVQFRYRKVAFVAVEETQNQLASRRLGCDLRPANAIPLRRCPTYKLSDIQICK